MTTLDVTKSTTTDMTSKVSNYSVDLKTTESASGSGETYYDNPYFTKWFGYYKLIPELKKPVDVFITWVLGQGYTTQNAREKVILEHINGWGEDTFLSILWNMLVMKKINGDAFAEIIKKDDIVQNIKPLDPASMRIVCNPQGRIIRYEQRNKVNSPKTYKVEEIFHISNDRVADEIHGTSICECVQWVLDAMHEAMTDKRRTLHRSTIRVMEVDEDDPARLTSLKTTYAEAINKGEVLLVPKGTGAIQDLVPPTTEHLEWLRYLENKLYQNLAVPKVILGGTAENTEASAKVSVIVFDPIFIKEITELELDVWNQLGFKIKINKQPSLMDNAQSLEQKGGQAQVGFQPNDVTAGVGK